MVFTIKITNSLIRLCECWFAHYKAPIFKVFQGANKMNIKTAFKIVSS